MDLKKVVASPNEGARDGTGLKHVKVGLGHADLERGLADIRHAFAKKGDATSSIGHMDLKKGPVDLGHALTQNDDATSSITHAGQKAPGPWTCACAEMRLHVINNASGRNRARGPCKCPTQKATPCHQ